jgi:hypothetical protein
MDAERLLKQIGEQLEDDEDEIAAISLLQQMSQATAAVLNSERQHGGSVLGKRTNVERNRAQGHQRMFKDYFADELTYNDILFRRRYRMRRQLFHH